MDPTDNPADASPVPAQRSPGPGEAPGAAAGERAMDDRSPARPAPAAPNDTQMVALGSRRPADAPPGGPTTRWTDNGGFAPVETNGHRNPDLGRHGGTTHVNGQNPVGGGTLPGSRSPFAPPAGPDTPPLYAPSPFGTAGNPPASDLPTDPLSPLDPPAEPGPDARDSAARPPAGPPAATGSAQVPTPLSRPAAEPPFAEPAGAGARAVPAEPQPGEHEAWAPPALRGPGAPEPAGKVDDVPPFPGFGTVTPPSTEPGPGQPTRWTRPEPSGESSPSRPGPWSRAEPGATPFRTDPLPPNPLQPPAVQSALPSELLKPEPVQPPQARQTPPVPPAPASPLQPAPGGRRSRADEEPELQPQGRRAAPAGEDERVRAESRPGGRRAAADAEETGRRARDEAPAGRRAARETAGSGPLRPGDVHETSIAFWDEAASGQFRAEWHEVKAQFVDDPVAALTRARSLLTEAVQELSEAMLAERDRLDPLSDKSVPDTESMRMAMRGYREFLDRILSL